MMKRKYMLLTLTIVIIGITSVACEKKASSKPPEINAVQSEKNDTTEESKENAVEIESQTESSDSQKETSEEKGMVIELSNTYTTKFSTANAFTYPNFVFDHPDNWAITKKEVTPTGEIVILTNAKETTKIILI